MCMTLSVHSLQVQNMGAAKSKVQVADFPISFLPFYSFYPWSPSCILHHQLLFKSEILVRHSHFPRSTPIHIPVGRLASSFRIQNGISKQEASNGNMGEVGRSGDGRSGRQETEDGRRETYETDGDGGRKLMSLAKSRARSGQHGMQRSNNIIS